MAIKYVVVLRAYDTVLDTSYDAIESGAFEYLSEAEAVANQFSETAKQIRKGAGRTRYTALITQREV